MSPHTAPAGLVVPASFGLPSPVADRLVALAETRGQHAAHAGALRWLTGERTRLRRTFADPDETPTEPELHLLAVLALLADIRGRVILPRADLSDVLRIDSHALAAAETWGIWRGSFRARRDSAPGSPRVSAFELRRPWPASEAPR